MKLNDIRIGNRFRKDIGNLESLKNSIREIGLLHPLVVSEKNELIAGYRRLKALQELGYEESSVTVVNLEDLAKGEVQENLVRKDFTVSEMVAIKRAMEPEIKEEAEQRMKIGKSDPTENFRKVDRSQRESRNILGSFVGVSGKTLRKAEIIVEAAENNPDKFGQLLKKVDNKKTSISYAYQTIKREKRHIETPELPTGIYDVILADPPWVYEFGIRGATDCHYSEMSTDQICELKIPCAENSVLFLWATAPKIQEALHVMESWGFTYKTHMIWVKDKIGTGYYFRGKHELLLLGKKGNIPSPMENSRPDSVLLAPRYEHSQKPNKVYSIIEKMFPNRKYLELFARKKREGWVVWGDEISEN